MSDSSTPYREALNIQEQVARIDRAMAETHKLMEEGLKLDSEARKYDRDRWIVPLTVSVTVFGGILAAVIARLPEILRAFGYNN